MLEGRGANDIIDGDRYLAVRISYRTDPADPATEVGSTDLMEHAALSGTWGRASLPGMTLQQAVFAGLVDPGNLVIVRELLTDDVTTGTDIAQFSGPADEYEVTDNGDGSFTVNHLAGAGADGIDTLWNIETLRFCNAVDANGVCTAPVIEPAIAVASPARRPCRSRPRGTTAAAAPVRDRRRRRRPGRADDHGHQHGRRHAERHGRHADRQPTPASSRSWTTAAPATRSVAAARASSRSASRRRCSPLLPAKAALR